jgi:hypothetical protein
MANDLLFGIQTNGIKHGEADGMPDIDTRFRMVRDAGVFDYIDKTPAPDEVEQFRKASAKYGLPVRAGGWFYTLGGDDDDLLRHNLELAKDLGSTVHNVQVTAKNAAGTPVTNQDVVDFYMYAYELGEKLGVEPCFEVHINMWSEDFRRIAPVARMVEAKGVPFRMTLDHSHVIFKIDNPDEQDIVGIREDVSVGYLVLDPTQPKAVTTEWIEAGWVRHCHARAAVPNNPKNTLMSHSDGSPGRGVQYPFVQPKPGDYHAPWSEEKLELWKTVIRQVMAFHAKDPSATLGQISTEFIPNPDYGGGCKYSLFEQGVACAVWMREEWAKASV